MAGLTPMHLLLILAIALIVIGPGKLPEVGAAIGKSLREFQKATGQLTDPIQSAPPAQQPIQPMQPMQPMQPQPPAQSYYAAPTYPAQPGPAYPPQLGVVEVVPPAPTTQLPPDNGAVPPAAPDND